MFKLPIMIGCYEDADKCTAVAKDTKFGGYSLFICRLKNRQSIGSKVEKDNIRNVICHLHFCKLDSLKEFKKAVDTAVELWEDGDSNDE